MSRNQRFAFLGIAALVVVVAIVIAATSGGSSSGSKHQTAGPATVTVVGGKPEGGVQKLSYRKGETVDLTVRSDTADEIHIHGYDLHQDVRKGGSVRFSFPATIDGVFVIELEKAKQQLASLEVTP
jgi:hypothetical protein